MTITDRLGRYPQAGIKSPCVAISTTNITLSGEQTIDSKAVTSGMRVLVGGQTDASENGVYIASTSAWTRAPDFNQNLEIQNGVLVAVVNASGTSNIYKVTYTDSSLVIGTSDLTVTGTTYGLLDDDTFAADDPGSAPSQQSAKAYIAAQFTAQLAAFISSYLLDEDDMASNSATQWSSQQALKAYVDNEVGNVTTTGSVMVEYSVDDGRVESGASQSNFTAGSLQLRGVILGAASNLGIVYPIPFPNRWDLGNVSVEIFWTVASGTGNVVWGIQGVAISDGDDIASAAYSTASTATETPTGQNDLDRTSITGHTISGAPADNDLCFLRVFRDGADGADTFTGNAYILKIRVTYNANAGNDG